MIPALFRNKFDSLAKQKRHGYRSTLRLLLTISLLFILMASLSGCIPGDNTYSASHRAGFFWGIWHGWLAPISLIISLFNKDIQIYEPFNTGWWYDLGYYMAIISGFGGLSLARRRKHQDE